MSKKLFYYGSSSGWADNYSVDFDGVNDHIILPNAFSALAQGSFSFWCHRHTAPAIGSELTMISFSDKDDALSAFKISLYNDGGIVYISLMNVENATFAFHAYASTTSITGNTWYHVEVMQTGAEYRIYVNAVNQTLTSIAGRPNTGTAWISNVTNIDFTALAVLQIGSTKIQYFNGLIDDIGIYNAGVPANVASHYNGGTPNDLRTLADAANLVGYYLMGDLNGTAEYPTIIDRISGNNGTMTNMVNTDIQNDVPP